MKTGNFAWQRRMHFIRITLILIAEVISFFFWAVDRMTTQGIDPNYQWNIVIWCFFGVLFLNWTWLWLEGKLLFDSENILRRLYTKRLRLQERKRPLEEILAAITDQNGKAIHTETAIEVWKTLPTYCFQKFDDIISSLRKKLMKIEDELKFLDQKENFWIQTQRKNFWLYFKSKI